MMGPSFATPTAPGTAPKPGAPGPRPSKPGDKPDDGAGLRILTYLRLHWLMILFCGALLSTAGALLAWDLLASKFESYAMLQVSSVPTVVANYNNPNQARTDFATYVKTSATLIKSEFVLNAALRDLKDTPTIKAQTEPLKYLDDELVVTWQDGSEVIRITFKGREPQDAKKIVDAVLKAFMSEWIQKDVAEKQQLLKKVEDEQLKLKKILQDKFGPQAPAAVALAGGAVPPGGVIPAGGAAPAAGVAPAGGIPAPLGTPPGTPLEVILDRLDPKILIGQLVQLRERVEQLPLTVADLQRQEGVIVSKLKALKEAPIPQTTLDAVDHDQDVVTAKLRMIAARSHYETWKGTGNPNAPPTQAILDKKAAYESLEQAWQETRKKKLETLDGFSRLKAAEQYAHELEEIHRSIDRSSEQYKHDKERLAAAEKRVLELPPPSDKGGGVLGARADLPYTTETGALMSTDAIYRKLIEQYYYVLMELNSPPRVRILQPGSQPTQKDTKKQILGTSFAGVLGFALVAIGAVGYESVCRRVSSLADVRGAMPTPVVGVVPYPARGTAERDPVKRAAANEAIDKLRAYVSQTWLSRGATSIAVTSPVGDEGKALTAFGLASSLAQAGYKTLLADFDLRDPALHTFAGVPNLTGACELLRGETDVRSAVQFLPSGLHLLPAGKWSDEARKAATGERLEAVIAKLKEPYDCVVLHGHAILTAAESVEVARRCEVVLVCARYRETATPLLKRATERVTTMEIPYTGVVYVGASEQEALC